MTSRPLALPALLLLPALALGCASAQAASSPRDALTAYAAALSEGRHADAYAWLSEDARRALPYAEFERMAKENPEELRQLAQGLLKPAGPPQITAQVTAPSGESLLLVYEEGAWRVDGSAIDLYSQASPKLAVASFVRAFENQRWDILMRFVPTAEAEGLDAKKLETNWTGEQKEELTRLTQAIKGALPTAQVEVVGEHATLAYGSSGTIELVLEDGRWKIQEFE